MKKHIALIIGTAILAGASSPGFAQLQRVELAGEPPEPPEPPELHAAAEVYDVVTSMVSAGGGSTASRTLIIPKESGDLKEFTEMEEDLNVMARILEKAAAGRTSKDRHAMGIWIHTGMSGSMPKNLYIEGHGALFFLNVNFPLLPPATKPTETESKDDTSTEWEEARREIYRSPGMGLEQFELNLNKVPLLGGPVEEYNSEKVEDLKSDLIAALKNATHIRKLKSDESVTVVVSGRSSATTVQKFVSGSGRAGTGGGRTMAVTKSASTDGQGTRLILRARKADVDAFQKDKLSLEEFRKKVTTIVY